VSGATLVAVRPLFRYCYRRDAWVLRLVGERIGPVLRSRTDWVSERSEPELTRAADRVGQLPRSRLIRPRTGLLAIAVTLAAAALGFLASRTIGSHQSSVAPRAQAASGVFSVSLPAGWRRQAAEPAQRYGLSDTITFAPATFARGEMLLVGRTATPASGLLPPSVLAAVARTASPEAVQLGGTMFYRYRSTAGVGSPASVYALPTTVGTIVGVCLAPAASSGFTGRCEQLLGTLKLASGTHTLGPSPGYAAALSAAIKKLNAVRSNAGSQLSAARSAPREASAATELAVAHADAASTIRRLSAGPASPANSALAAALRTTAAAYAALARAANHGDVRGYNEARASLAHAAGGLKSAFAQLRALGYSVA
jgi:hypothetical protein